MDDASQVQPGAAARGPRWPGASRIHLFVAWCLAVIAAAAVLPMDSDAARARLATLATVIVVWILLSLVTAGRPSMPILGKDGRLSTTKFQAGVWTLALMAGLAYIAWVSVFSDRSLAETFEVQEPTIEAGTDETGFFDGLRPEYLLLLGGPFTALLGAKAIVSSRVSNGELQKVSTPEVQRQLEPAAAGAPEQPTGRVRDLFSDDSGQTDLVDLQFLGFNLMALLYYAVALLGTDAPTTLPELPPVLVALTGPAALAYLADKFIERDPPQLRAVTPAEAAPGDIVVLHGANFAPAGAVAQAPDPPPDPAPDEEDEDEDEEPEGDGPAPDPALVSAESPADQPPADPGPTFGVQVTVGGELARVVSVSEDGTQARIEVPRLARARRSADVVLTTTAGVSTTPIALSYLGPAIRALSPSTVRIEGPPEAEQHVRILGDALRNVYVRIDGQQLSPPHVVPDPHVRGALRLTLRTDTLGRLGAGPHEITVVDQQGNSGGPVTLTVV